MSKYESTILQWRSQDFALEAGGHPTTKSRTYKGNVLSSFVTPAYMNALETMVPTDKQQKFQVCEKLSGDNNRGS